MHAYTTFHHLVTLHNLKSSHRNSKEQNRIIAAKQAVASTPCCSWRLVPPLQSFRPQNVHGTNATTSRCRPRGRTNKSAPKSCAQHPDLQRARSAGAGSTGFARQPKQLLALSLSTPPLLPPATCSRAARQHLDLSSGCGAHHRH